MNQWLLLLLVVVISGCHALSHQTISPKSKEAMMNQARELLVEERFYEAREVMAGVLDRNSGDPGAEKLMAEILDREIAWQKEAFEVKAVEELAPDEKKNEAKTWLERAKMLMLSRQYDEAMLAAEKVFLYEPESADASGLIDQIKENALREGKGDQLFLKGLAEEEIDERIKRYRLQARQWMQTGQWGAARLAVEKIILLRPEDKEALRLYDTIQRRKLNRHETGKTL